MEEYSTASPDSGSDPRCLAEEGVGEGAAVAGAGLAEVVLEGGEWPNIFLPPVSASEDAPAAGRRRVGNKLLPSVHFGCSIHTPSPEAVLVVGWRPGGSRGACCR